MARYADIDVLLEHLTTSDEGNFRTAITQWLEMHQVEDVAPVVHAHWEEYYGDDKCTSCGFVCGDSFYLGSASFCPNCGAKMDEVAG